MVTSVPWKRERDITEITPLWELLPSNLSWRPIGSRQSMTGQLSRSMQYDELERQYKCSARDNTSESELNAAWLN